MDEGMLGLSLADRGQDSEMLSKALRVAHSVPGRTRCLAEPPTEAQS